MNGARKGYPQAMIREKMSFPDTQGESCFARLRYCLASLRCLSH